MTLRPLPALKDNYIWMLDDGHHAVVVDPGDPQPVLQALAFHGLQLQAILITHHHPDHTAGVAPLQQATHAAVWGPAGLSIKATVQTIEAGKQLQLLGHTWRVMALPGHTNDHLAYWNDTESIVFCGDVLFSAGCGRLFEGTAGQMQASLAQLSALPDATRVCCSHEYTVHNLKFSLAVEPHNQAVQDHYAHCMALRAQGRATLPSSIGLEKQINPFLRSHLPTVIDAVRQHDADQSQRIGTFAALRQWKNEFV